MKSYVDVLGASVIVVVCCKMNGGLVIAVECGGCNDGVEKLGSEPAKPNALFRSVCRGHVFGFGG